MVDKPDWAFGQFNAEAIEAKRAYYLSLRTEEEEAQQVQKVVREEMRLRNPRPTPNAKPDRNIAIWRERKEGGTTLRGLADKYGLSPERIRQIVAKEDRRRERIAYFDELRKQKEGASYGG